MVIKNPNGFEGGKIVNGMVSRLDIFPTICEYLNSDKPEWLEGKSFLPLITNEKMEINEEIFAETNFHASYEPARSVRTLKYKYIKYFDGRSKINLPNCDDSPSKTFLLDCGLKEKPVHSEQLFDLRFDPQERQNLAQDVKYNDILLKMRDRLQKWMVKTNDPLLNGPIVSPLGAIVNDPEGLSPKEKPLN